MRERFVFDIKNNVVKFIDFRERHARLCNCRIKLGDTDMVAAKIKFVSASQHAIRIVFLEHFARANYKRLIFVNAFWNNRARSNPGCHHASMNIWRTTHDLNKAFFVARNAVHLATIVDIAERKVSIWNFLGTFNFDSKNIVVFMRFVDNIFDLDQARADQTNKLVVRDIDVDVFFEPIKRN